MEQPFRARPPATPLSSVMESGGGEEEMSQYLVCPSVAHLNFQNICLASSANVLLASDHCTGSTRTSLRRERFERDLQQLSSCYGAEGEAIPMEAIYCQTGISSQLRKLAAQYPAISPPTPLSAFQHPSCVLEHMKTTVVTQRYSITQVLRHLVFFCRS